MKRRKTCLILFTDEYLKPLVKLGFFTLNIIVCCFSKDEIVAYQNLTKISKNFAFFETFFKVFLCKECFLYRHSLIILMRKQKKKKLKKLKRKIKNISSELLNF